MKTRNTEDIHLISIARDLTFEQAENFCRTYRGTIAKRKTIVVKSDTDHLSKFAEVAEVRQMQGNYYADGITETARESESEIIVYLSSMRHTCYDYTWISDLVLPLQDYRCGMSGTLTECYYDRIARSSSDIFEPQIHIQGGCFAASRHALLECGYGKFPQIFSDVYLSWSMIRHGYYLANVPSICASAGGFSSSLKMSVGYPGNTLRERLFEAECQRESDINEHLEILRHYAGRSARVVEFGTRKGISTLALLHGQPESLVTVDIDPSLVDVDWLLDCCGDVRFSSVIGDSLQYRFDVADLLFIDTDHNYRQLSSELNLHADAVTRWIICHDTVSFPECRRAIGDFLTTHLDWHLLLEKHNNNGLCVLERRETGSSQCFNEKASQ